MPGRILTHNHPSGSTFSFEDIYMFEIHGLKEIRATTGQGTFSLFRINQYSFDNLTSQNLMAEECKHAINVKKADTDKRFEETMNLYYENKISVEEFELQCAKLNSELNVFRDGWLNNNASRYGYKYKFERWG